MKHYRLRYVMHDPSELKTEDKYMAEPSPLSLDAEPGAIRRSMPSTSSRNCEIVTAAFIESYNDHGDELPPTVASALADSTVTNELLVAV